MSALPVVSEWNEGGRGEGKNGYVARNIGGEMREGESGDNAPDGRPIRERGGEERHSVRILRVEVVLLDIQLLVENDGTTVNRMARRVLGEVVVEGVPDLPLENVLIVHLDRDQQR